MWNHVDAHAGTIRQAAATSACVNAWRNDCQNKVIAGRLGWRLAADRTQARRRWLRWDLQHTAIPVQHVHAGVRLHAAHNRPSPSDLQGSAGTAAKCHRKHRYCIRTGNRPEAHSHRRRGPGALASVALLFVPQESPRLHVLLGRCAPWHRLQLLPRLPLRRSCCQQDALSTVPCSSGYLRAAASAHIAARLARRMTPTHTAPSS